MTRHPSDSRPLSIRTAAALPLAALALFAGAGASRAPQRPAPVTTQTVPLLWTDIDGRGYGPTHLRAATATVFLFVSTDCPLASAYAARVRALESAYQPRRVNFVLVNAHPTDTPEAARTWATERGLPIVTVKDDGGRLTRRLGAGRTPEAVVVGRDGVPLYRGPIDDASDPARVRTRHLHDALESILAGKPVARPVVPMTEGCLIPLPTKAAVKPAPGAAVTYARDVAPLLNRACVPCHRDGQVAPFALDSYAQAKLWAPMVAESTRRKIMPPWKAAPGYGAFHGDVSLSDADIALLDRWQLQGAPAGDLKSAPPPPPAVQGWQAGKPDVEVPMGRPYPLTPDDPDNYRCFILPAEFKEDTYVTLSQVLPGNPAVVHHMEVYVVSDADKRARVEKADAADPEYGFDNPTPGNGLLLDAGYSIFTWAPGGSTLPLPEGVAYKVPKGSRLVLEVHYHRSGRAETDRSTLGLTFARGVVDRVVRRIPFGIEPDKLVLPPGKARIPVSNSVTLPTPSTCYAIFPHMHQLGKEMRVWADVPGRGRVEMVWIKDWDFGWQQTYRYKEPIDLPKGTTLHLEAVYDNSALNPRNPHRPPREVRYGEATNEEMCFGFLYFAPDGQKLNITPAPWSESVVLNPPP